jgi:hypothetical protein
LILNSIQGYKEFLRKGFFEMTMQRGVLKPCKSYRDELPEEIVADMQYCAWPETGEIVRDGRVQLKIKSIQPVKESDILVEGEYDFMPVTAGLFCIGTVLQLRKSDGDWCWRVK